MDLALPRFAMAEGPRQVHPPWSVMSESPASPAPSQIEPRGGEDSHCSMDQKSISSLYLILDALSSSSDEESLDVKKCEDFAVTIVCSSEEAGTRVNSEEVLSDEDFPVVFGTRDIRPVVRRRANPPGGQTSRTARMDSRQGPPAPAGIVSRTVSTSPLTLDLTVMCTPGTEVLRPGAAAQGVLPPGTVANTVAAFDTSTPAVATPAPVVGQPEPKAKEFSTLRLSESPDCFRRSDYRPRLPNPRCRGEQQRTRRRLFHPTEFRTRVVCSMCRHFHQDSSFGLLGGAEWPRLKGFYCQRC